MTKNIPNYRRNKSKGYDEYLEIQAKKEGTTPEEMKRELWTTFKKVGKIHQSVTRLRNL